MWDFGFFLQSVLLGLGLAMDAFSVSLANGLNENKMKAPRMCLIAGVFAFFQFAMPMIGWVCVHTLVSVFSGLVDVIPWIALALLGFIGGKMLYEGIKVGEDEEPVAVGFVALLVQGVATSIDALSVGFTIAEHDLLQALVCCLLIAVVTFFLCIGGLAIGKRFGTHLAGKAGILGGIILMLMGLKIFVSGVFGI